MNRLIGSIVMVCVVGMFAVPAGLFGAASAEEVRKADERPCNAETEIGACCPRRNHAFVSQTDDSNSTSASP